MNGPDPDAAAALHHLYHYGPLTATLAAHLWSRASIPAWDHTLDTLIQAGLAGRDPRTNDVHAGLDEDAARRAYARLSGEQACASCGCTPSWSCPGGCCWLIRDQCDACEPPDERPGAALCADSAGPGAPAR